MRQQGDSDNRIRYWDEYAVGYSSYQQGSMPGRIVDWMLETGYLRSEFSVLEVGCGPGTYSLELAPKVRILTCMDSSERMLARLSAGAKEKGLTNIELFHQDWGRYIPKKGYAACIASLCPFPDTDASLRRMEGAARESCATVSWRFHGGERLRTAVWESLGIERPVNRQAAAVAEWLDDNGRERLTETFTERVKARIPVDEAVSRECAAFRANGVDEDVSDVVRELMDPCIEDGCYVYDWENSLTVHCWHPVSR